MDSYVIFYVCSVQTYLMRDDEMSLAELKLDV